MLFSDTAVFGGGEAMAEVDRRGAVVEGSHPRSCRFLPSNIPPYPPAGVGAGRGAVPFLQKKTYFYLPHGLSKIKADIAFRSVYSSITADILLGGGGDAKKHFFKNLTDDLTDAIFRGILSPTDSIFTDKRVKQSWT